MRARDFRDEIFEGFTARDVLVYVIEFWVFLPSNVIWVKRVAVVCIEEFDDR